MWDVLDKDFTRDEKGLFLKVIHVFYATSLVVRALSFTHDSTSVCLSVHTFICKSSIRLQLNNLSFPSFEIYTQGQ